MLHQLWHGRACLDASTQRALLSTTCLLDGKQDDAHEHAAPVARRKHVGVACLALLILVLARHCAQRSTCTSSMLPAARGFAFHPTQPTAWHAAMPLLMLLATHHAGPAASGVQAARSEQQAAAAAAAHAAHLLPAPPLTAPPARPAPTACARPRRPVRPCPRTPASAGSRGTPAACLRGAWRGACACERVRACVRAHACARHACTCAWTRWGMRSVCMQPT